MESKIYFLLLRYALSDINYHYDNPHMSSSHSSSDFNSDRNNLYWMELTVDNESNRHRSDLDLDLQRNHK